MQSSPSSIWALDLNNHKLIFSPEFPYAPTLDNFTTTLQRFINIERETYVRSLYQRSKLTAEPKTLSYFSEKFRVLKFSRRRLPQAMVSQNLCNASQR